MSHFCCARCHNPIELPAQPSRRETRIRWFGVGFALAAVLGYFFVAEPLEKIGKGCLRMADAYYDLLPAATKKMVGPPARPPQWAAEAEEANRGRR
jgi:hypothetical protein